MMKPSPSAWRCGGVASGADGVRRRGPWDGASAPISEAPELPHPSARRGLPKAGAWALPGQLGSVMEPGATAGGVGGRGTCPGHTHTVVSVEKWPLGYASPTSTGRPPPPPPPHACTELPPGRRSGSRSGGVQDGPPCIVHRRLLRLDSGGLCEPRDLRQRLHLLNGDKDAPLRVGVTSISTATSQDTEGRHGG